LMQAVAAQLGLALESARLHRETQLRAARDRILGDVSSRIRETLDVDAVLKTAALEMQRALGLSRMTVQLATQPEESGAE
jgi:GAF domain-containing protein